MANAVQQWSTPPIDLKLLENEVHVWRAFLRVPASVLYTLQQLLSKEEVIRAQRFHFERDRNSFIVAHGVLRDLLGRYLNTNPRQLCFRNNTYGKPSVNLPTVEISQLSFNLSCSNEIALYAFMNAGQIGIDVEYMRSDIEYEQLARYSFSPTEQVNLQALAGARTQTAFFNCWTRKEAYIKARGVGFSLPLDLFDVSLWPGEPPALLSSREDPQETARWSLHDLTPCPGYAGALAIEGSGQHISYWHWKNDDIV
jgi:4'-phosphopantetheinyl transferase